MNGFEIFLILLLTRLVLPFGVLLLVGEWIRKREIHYWLRM